MIFNPLYDSNEIDVNRWVEGVEEYLLDFDSLPEKLKPLVLSLFRYIRKVYGKTTPTWKDRSKPKRKKKTAD